MEPPVRGDGVHRHDDDERRNRTAPAQTSGQTAPRGDLAAGVSAEISAETGVTEATKASTPSSPTEPHNNSTHPQITRSDEGGIGVAESDVPSH